MKKILVTGAGGFIGSHLTELLVTKDFGQKRALYSQYKHQWGVGLETIVPLNGEEM